MKEAINISIGFPGLLLLAFIILKLCGVITWSWWWVLSPAWMASCIVLIIACVCLIIWCAVK